MAQFYSLEAEREVIGGLLLQTDKVSEVFETLQSEDFYFPDLREIYEIIKRKYEAGEVVSLTTVSEEMVNNKSFSQSPYSVLAGLTDFYITSESCIASARLVKEKGVLRRIDEGWNKIKEILEEPNITSEKVIEETERIVYNIGSYSKNTLEHISKYIQEVDNRLQGIAVNNLGYQSGYSFLDETISGLRKGELIIVAGRPSMGKTALALNMLYNLAKGGVEVALFSLEMDAISIATRLIALDSKVPIWQVRGVDNREVREKCLESFAYLSSFPIYINDNPLVEPTQIRGILRRHKNVQAIAVDHIQQMRLKKSENKVLEVTEIARELKSIAREFNIPVIAISQLSRGVESRENKRPQLSDLRESGAIEQEADVVLLLYRDDYYKKDKGEEKEVNIEVEVAKNRNGAVRVVNLSFNKETNKFEDISSVELD